LTCSRTTTTVVCWHAFSPLIKEE